MRLTKAEKLALLLTVLTLVFTAGVHMGQDARRDELSISAVEQTQQPEAPEPSGEEALTPVNINTAGVEELMSLEGIGEKLAGRIVAYREENGDFERAQDITCVQGIGDGIYSKICTDITV